LFEQEINGDSILEFYEEFSSGRLKPYLKSEPVPESQPDHVQTVVGHSFDDVVLNDEHDVLVEFYAPWCGHCKQLAPLLEEAATKLAGVKGLVIAKVDSTANEIEGVHVQGYPTIKFYPAHGKSSPVDFDGERTAEGVVSWLKTHATHAHWNEFSEDL